jgi:hypothetical protein
VITMLNDLDKETLRDLLERNGARALLTAFGEELAAFAGRQEASGNKLRAVALSFDAKTIKLIAPRLWSASS